MKPVTIEFTDKNLTGHAGLVHFGKFMQKLKLTELLRKHLSISRATNAEYEVAEVVVMLILGVLAGAKHLSHLALLRTDRVIRRLFNWDQFPDDSTIGRIFQLFSHASCQELAEVENVIRRRVWRQKWRGRVTLEFDSSVIGVFGSQEGAAVGYNPDKKGRKSYHPLFCFLAETRECLHHWFRCGNAYSANGIEEFAKECFARLPTGVWKVFVRANSAFFNGAFFDFLESRGAWYLIKVKMRNLSTLLARQTWKTLRRRPGWETTDFNYQCTGWSHPRRLVAVRRLVVVLTEGVLFPQSTYEYFCYVTNDQLTPWQAHQTYGQRAASENWLEWCKTQMAAGTIRTQNFWANSAIFQTGIFAYNLMVWMMWLTQGQKLREEPNTIRFWLIQAPARLLTAGHRLVLKLSTNWIFKQRWLELENALHRLNFI
jgi:Transposase DDE domain group 1